MTTALDRLLTGYYNSNPVDPATNPGGMGLGGHVVNLPALLQDMGVVAGDLNAAVLDAAAVSSAAAVIADQLAQVTALAGPVIAGLATHGMPARAQVADLTALARSGWFYATAVATGRPAGEDGGFVWAVSDGAADNGAQIFTGETTGKTYTRRRVAGAWAAWVELTTADTVIDTAFGAENVLASAATVDLGAAGSRLVEITGAAAITSFGASAEATNPHYLVRFAGSLTLTHHATDLILPGGRSIVTAAGDQAILQYLGAGDWRCAVYMRASGEALVAAGYGAETVLASAATVDLGTAAAQAVLITGGTAITSFGAGASVARPIYRLRFGGALTLTHGADLALPGAANIATAAGDAAVALYLGAGAWRVVGYQRADGKAPATALASVATAKAGAAADLAVTPAGLAGTVQSSCMTYAGDTDAAADVLVVDLVPAIAALVVGMTLTFKVSSTNAGSVGLNLNGLGEVSIKRHGRLLKAGELRDGQIYQVTYDGSFWQLISPSEAVIRASAYITQAVAGTLVGSSPYFTLTRQSAGNYTINLTDAVASIADWGAAIMVGVAASNVVMAANEKTKTSAAMTLQVRNGGNNLDDPSSFDITVWVKP